MPLKRIWIGFEKYVCGEVVGIGFKDRCTDDYHLAKPKVKNITHMNEIIRIYGKMMEKEGCVFRLIKPQMHRWK